jgi:uncharacterized membrane protein (UPF0127 family)
MLFGLFQSPPDPDANRSGPSPDKAKLVYVSNRSCGTVVATVVTVAETPAKRRRGLLGHPALGPQEGIWIVPCESVHTVGMRYHIDLVYLDRRSRVVKIVEALAPNRISLCLRARSVIELAPGTVHRSGTQVGHQLSLRATDTLQES